MTLQPGDKLNKGKYTIQETLKKVGLYPQETRQQIEKLLPSPSPSPTPKSIEGAKGLDGNNSNF